MALRLAYDLNFEDLYETSGLDRVDRAFLDFLNEDLRARLLEARETAQELDPKVEADFSGF